MFVRLSLSNPAATHHDEVVAIEDKLLAFFAAQPGFIDGYRLTSDEHVGRVTIWDSEASAEHVATSDHTLALRSELLRLIDGEPLEMALEGLQSKKS